MLERVSNKIADKWVRMSIIEREYKQVYSYGIALLLSSLIGISLILILGLIISSILHSLIFLVVFIPVRFYFGGYHAKRFVTCNLISVSVFVSVLMFAKSIGITLTSIIIINVVAVTVCLLMAPIESEYKPIDRRTRKRCKCISVVLMMIGFMASLFMYGFFEDISAIVTYTLLSVVVLAIIAQINLFVERRIQNESSF